MRIGTGSSSEWGYGMAGWTKRNAYLMAARHRYPIDWNHLLAGYDVLNGNLRGKSYGLTSHRTLEHKMCCHWMPIKSQPVSRCISKKKWIHWTNCWPQNLYTNSRHLLFAWRYVSKQYVPLGWTSSSSDGSTSLTLSILRLWAFSLPINKPPIHQNKWQLYHFFSFFGVIMCTGMASRMSWKFHFGVTSPALKEATRNVSWWRGKTPPQVSNGWSMLPPADRVPEYWIPINVPGYKDLGQCVQGLSAILAHIIWHVNA